MDKVALITGAAGGLGQSMASRLSNAGWKLIVVSRDAERLTRIYGSDHLQIVGDCATDAGARQIIADAKEAGMLPTVLAHCVGNIRLGALHRMQPTDFMDCLTANLVTAFHMLAAFIGGLRAANLSGSAVLVSSVAAQIGTPNHEAVAAAKAGIEGLVRGAAATYAPYGIRVNAVAPGIMESPATEKILGAPSARDAAARQYALPGIGSTDELADLMAWLLAENSQRVTAQVWALDGGFTGIRPLVK